LSAEELHGVDSTFLSPEKANDLLPPELRLDPDEWAFRRLRILPHMRAHQDLIRRGKQMIAAGASIEEVAEATNMSTYNAGFTFRTALAERESAAATPKIGDRDQ
jgi:hypothetical protein